MSPAVRSVIERFLAESTPAERCLLALVASTPFLLIYMGLHTWALWSDTTRGGVRAPALLALLVAHALMVLVALALMAWLWPRRKDNAPLPMAELATSLSIGLAHSSVLVAVGLFTAGPALVLLGELIVGLLLFTRRTMWLSYAVCVSLIAAADLGSLAGWWPYAPAITPGAFAQGQAVWWFELWRSLVLYMGALVVISLILMLFWRLDTVHARLNHLSVTDGLTGLANRRHFMARLEQEVQRQQRTGRALALVIVDADHFKQVNDRHGHPAGDKVLQTLAELLSMGVRAPTDVAARLGGEEFALLLPDAGEASALVVCERIRTQLRQHGFHSASGPFQVTLSMGLVEALNLPAPAILAAADANLYMAKAAGRDRVMRSCPGASQVRVPEEHA